MSPKPVIKISKTVHDKVAALFYLLLRCGYIITNQWLTLNARTSSGQSSGWPKLVPAKNQPNHNWGTIRTLTPTGRAHITMITLWSFLLYPKVKSERQTYFNNKHNWKMKNNKNQLSFQQHSTRCQYSTTQSLPELAVWDTWPILCH